MGPFLNSTLSTRRTAGACLGVSSCHKARALRGVDAAQLDGSETRGCPIVSGSPRVADEAGGHLPEPGEAEKLPAPPGIKLGMLPGPPPAKLPGIKLGMLPGPPPAKLPV